MYPVPCVNTSSIKTIQQTKCINKRAPTYWNFRLMKSKLGWIVSIPLYPIAMVSEINYEWCWDTNCI